MRTPRQIVKEMWGLRPIMDRYLDMQRGYHVRGDHGEAARCQDVLDGLFGELRRYRGELEQAKGAAV